MTTAPPGDPAAAPVLADASTAALPGDATAAPLLNDPVELLRRHDALQRPAMQPLLRFAARIRRETGQPVPEADPADGGTAARLLLLLETPGPSIRGTGFVSRDNPTPTGRNLRRFLTEAGIPREDVLIWNAVPWVIHAPGARNRPPRPAEIRAGQNWLPPLLALLPRLAVAVLSGRVAGLSAEVLRDARPALPVLLMPHPSPTITCTSPAVPARIAAALAEAAALLHLPGRSAA
ncbi:uracil-DNA glycosylase [Roseomonas sp. BN140053]|uniref:uracil-DNA glycosylase n=1 Tax=Roseomonas sp. BN140053 TaxID=3391898 RepID=UPI0039E92FCB